MRAVGAAVLVLLFVPTIPKACIPKPPGPTPTPSPTATPTPVPTPTPTPTPGPTPTPPAPSCFPDGDADQIPGAQAMMIETVKQAEEILKNEQPAMFDRDFQGLADHSYNGENVFYQEMVRVMARLGACSKQTDDARDKLSVVRPDANVEAFHLVNEGGFLLLTPEAAFARGGVFKPKSPAPTPTPSPVPTPPGVEACSRCGSPNPGPKATSLFRYKQHGRICDTTLNVYAKDPPFQDAGPFENYCFLVGRVNPDGSGQLWCVVRSEGAPDRLDCEDCVVGGRGPIWRGTGADCIVNVAENPWQATGENCAELLVCTRDGRACQNVYAPKDDHTECVR